MLCGGTFAYKAKLQTCVAASSMESEFMAPAAVHAAKIAKYLRAMMADLGFPQAGPATKIYGV